MNRLTIALLLALMLAVVTGVMVALFQQHTIISLRQENARLTHGQGTTESIPMADIPGRYRWIKDGVESGFISLNADHSAVGASGRTAWRGQPYRWFYEGGQLVIVWGDTPARFTESSGPGNFSGKENNKPVQIIKEP
jgi:hypothetical protein